MMLERLLGRSKTKKPAEGSIAPDFSLATLDGGRFTLAESLQAGPVAIAFFEVFCPTCQLTFPFLERLHQAYRNDPVTLCGISQDDAEQSQQFSKQFGVSFPIALDDDELSASKSYVFHHVPAIFLIDRTGQIRLRFSGFSKASLIRLSEEIASLISRPPDPVFLPDEVVPEAKPG